HRQRVGRDATGLGALRLVAREAHFGLRRLAQHVLVRSMDAVAVRAGHAPAFMLAPGPVRPRENTRLVTLETRGAPLRGGRWITLCERDERAEPLGTRGCHM